MSGVEIESREELEAWLNGQPKEFAQVIAARVALRVLPLAFRIGASDRWVAKHSLDLLRSGGISWAARNIPAYDMRRTATSAAASSSSASSSSAAVSTTAVYAAYVATLAYSSDWAAESAAAAASSAADSAAYAAFALSNTSTQAVAVAVDTIWESVSADCMLLVEMQGSAATAAQALTSHQLWPQGEPAWFVPAWKHAKERLLQLDANFQVWLTWYNRRLVGQSSAFHLSRKADKELQIQIFDQPDEWWKRGHAAVNADIAAWIEKAAVDNDADDADEILAKLPPQNPNSLTFRQTVSGKVGLDPRVGDPELLSDEAAQDRHAEARDEARRLLALAQGSNAAQRLVGPLERYLAALGDTIGDLRPGLVTQRGERLRQYLADYEAETPNPDLEPLPPELLSGLKSARAAHNVLVGIDPLLRRMDSALLGPDVKPALIAPADLRAMAKDAAELGLIDEEARDALDEAANLAPPIPDATNRRSAWSGEAALNLTIELYFMVLSNRIKTSAGLMTVSAAIELLPAQVTVIGGTSLFIGFSNWVKKREAGLLRLLERYPDCQKLWKHMSNLLMPEDKDRKL